MSIFNRDTIAAFATASSSGAVALLRISGPNSLKILEEITGKTGFEPRRVKLVKIYDGKDILDHAVAVFYAAPASYTGEDIVELSLHAAPYIKARILEILAQKGVLPAKAGEFSMRAFLNGKIDLAQAQGVADIIASKNKTAHKAAMYSLEGKLSEKFKNIRADLSSLLAQAEVRIDDTDGELPPLDAEETSALLSAVRKETESLAATFSAGRLVKDGIRVAIIGLPNSGKSSLLNLLLGYDRAIVSEAPGTTRDTIEADFETLGHRIVLTDTAGIREHSLDPAEKEGMLRSRRAVQNADIIIFVKDITAPDSPAQGKLLEDVQKEGKPIITVLNKSDLRAQNKRDGDVCTSCFTGAGIEDLKNKIIAAAGLCALQEDDILITSAAHYDALLKAGAELKQAAAKTKDLELFAEHLRAALRSLQELIGEVTADDVLDIIFSKFCVGK